MTGRLDGRIALITGASRGIGRAIALRYAQEGAHVIAVARTVGALEELDDEIKAQGSTGGATLVPLDLKDLPAIDRLGGAIFERWGKLDILVANAAILGVLTPLAHLTPEVFDDIMLVNVTATWRLIRSFDPLLRASDSGRGIFVTSGAARKFKAYWGPYATSKAALEAMVLTYADELEITNAKVNLLDPGRTRTKMRANAMPGEDPMSVKPPEALGDLFVELAESSCAANGKIFGPPNIAV
jgi:NAD(P)-dependent dehydrogenase (short-subunit alcohol dehydrogenase family)